METELRQIKDYVVNVLESMPTPLLGFDDQGRVTQWNRAAGAMFGVASEAAPGPAAAGIWQAPSRPISPG